MVLLMNLEKIIERIESLHYWDARVLHLSCEYFGDEVNLIYEDDQEFCVVYKFLQCYRTDFSHLTDYPKDVPYRELTKGQIPFFIQNIEIKIESELYIFNINAFPLYLEICCKDIEISKVRKEECAIMNNKGD